MVKLWTRRFILASLITMVGSLYIAAGSQCEPADSKEKPAEVSKETETPKEETKVEATTTANADDLKSKEAEAPKEAKVEAIAVTNMDHLKQVLKENDFSPGTASNSETQVPRIKFANFPKDMRQAKDHKTKKDLFVNIMLPMILHENEIIMKERESILELKKTVDSGKSLRHSEKFWLNKICQKYKMKNQDLDELLRRADIIPPSLALGQATIECGMGISYAALNKHSPFGMTVSKKVLAYKDLSESVSAYICNLNSNQAYKTMRKTRAELRKAGKDMNGNVLIGDMIAYCEFGKPYINQVRAAIKQNDLMKYDNLNLAPKEKA
jgi:Bax protein